MKKNLQDDAPFMQQFTQATNLVSFFEEMNTHFRTAPRETNAQTTALIQSLPALEAIVMQADRFKSAPACRHRRGPRRCLTRATRWWAS